MITKEPKNSDKYYWTSHAKHKMRQYGLSVQRITRVIRAPLRKEGGIAGKETIAVMQPQSMRRGADGQKTWTSEIWVMYKIAKENEIKDEKKKIYQDDNMTQFLANISGTQKQIRIISAWRYPGKTNSAEDLPEQIMDEIAEIA